MTALQRCSWCGADPLYRAYHDQEWGVPLHDDRKLFELLILEGMQAGLSWITILRKRQHFRAAFDQFEAARIARYDAGKLAELLANAAIVRNRLKISAAVQNAKVFLRLQQEYASFDDYIWQFVDGKPIINAWRSLDEVPAKTTAAEAMSKDLKRRGFKFVGPTICYAFMQSAGMVNDHVVECFRYTELS
jgi:DNA-3-methyladenine glycosylase I